MKARESLWSVRIPRYFFSNVEKSSKAAAAEKLQSKKQ